MIGSWPIKLHSLLPRYNNHKWYMRHGTLADNFTPVNKTVLCVAVLDSLMGKSGWLSGFCLCLSALWTPVWYPDQSPARRLGFSVPTCAWLRAVFPIGVFSSHWNLFIVFSTTSWCDVSIGRFADYITSPDTSRRQQLRQLLSCPLVNAFVPLKCSSSKLRFLHGVPFSCTRRKCLGALALSNCSIQGAGSYRKW